MFHHYQHCILTYTFAICSIKLLTYLLNVILYSLSRYVLSRFKAVASQYGVRSKMQSKGVIKSAIWMSFAETEPMVRASGSQPPEAQFSNFWNHVFVCTNHRHVHGHTLSQVPELTGHTQPIYPRWFQ